MLQLKYQYHLNKYFLAFPLWLSRLRTWPVPMRMQVQSLVSLSGLRIQHYSELWCRSQTQLDLALLWLWRRPAAVALIQPLAWEPPYVAGAAK